MYIAHQAPPSMGFPRQEYWSGVPRPPPWDLQTYFSCVFCIGRWIPYRWATWEAHTHVGVTLKVTVQGSTCEIEHPKDVVLKFELKKKIKHQTLLRWFRCRLVKDVYLGTRELLIEPFSFSLSQFWPLRCGMDTFIWSLFQGLASVVGSMQLDPSLSPISGLAGNLGVRGLPVHVLCVTRKGKWR